VIIVTGGNSGTGYATCQTLYNAGATVYMASRSSTKALEAISNIKKGGVFGITGITFPTPTESVRGKGKGRLESLEVDLSDLESVGRFVEEFKGREKKLDVLFANAGVMAS
jgi:NAD(P)-dependent dehydrogenase (short-subunit alcohol dehydrogenase family)